MSEPLLSFMLKVYRKEESIKDSNLEGIKISQRVMNHIGSHKMIILDSLGSKILAQPLEEETWLKHLSLMSFFE